MQSFSTKLTTAQAAFLQTLLPKHYSIQIATLDSKRNRLLKKLDDSFQTDYALPAKRTSAKQTIQSHNHKSEAHNIVEENQRDNKITTVMVDQSNGALKYHDLKHRNSNLDQESLLKLLDKLKNNRTSWPFRRPVDPVAQGVPDYAEIVKQPMDLSTIETKLKNSSYSTQKDFHSDLKKIISNSYLFNPEETSLYAITQKFEAFYIKACEDMIKNTNKLPQKYQKSQISDLVEIVPQSSMRVIEKQAILANEKGSEQCISQQPTKGSFSLAQRLSVRERQKLIHQIYELPQNDIINLINIVDDGNFPKDWREFEIDLREIDDEKFKKIIALVNQK